MERAVDDRVSGEAVAPISLGGVPIDLDTVTLHLSEHLGDAWTARWQGLPPALQELLARQLPGHDPEALYHCTQVLLPPGARVTWVPGLLTDLGAEEATAWAFRRGMARLAPALAMLVVGWLDL